MESFGNFINAFNGLVWSMGDTGCGLMAWFNIIAILVLSAKSCAILKD